MMGSRTVRIRVGARGVLRQLAREDGEPMQEVLARAVEAYRRLRFLKRVNESYVALRSDPLAWQAELDERAIWDNALLDDLEHD
jgi:hypothetical protein